MSHLNQGGRWRRPAFVQNTLGQVLTQLLEEGAPYVIEEIIIFGAVFLVTVDEAFYEPENQKRKQRVNTEDELLKHK